MKADFFISFKLSLLISPWFRGIKDSEYLPHLIAAIVPAHQPI
jgi:hypothetical protein